MKSNQPIFLCGMMGAGKSTIGPRLADLMEKPFADLDQIIEETEKMSIPAIFERKGESWFRKRERELLIQTAREFNGVLALGGGSLQNQELTDQLKMYGWLVYLRPELQQLSARLADSTNRPMLAGESGEGILKWLKSLLYEIEPLFKLINFNIKTGNFPPDEIWQIILKKLTPNEA